MVQSRSRRSAKAAVMHPWRKVTAAVVIKCWDCGLELFTIRSPQRLSVTFVDGLRYVELTCPHCHSTNAYDVSNEDSDDFILNAVNAPLPDPEIDEEGELA